MRKEMIKVLYKRPGKNLVEVTIPNELEWLQGAVEGFVESVSLRPDLVMLVNEEGKLDKMQHNFYMPHDDIVGPVVFAGVDGDELTDCPLSKKDMQDYLQEMEALYEA